MPDPTLTGLRVAITTFFALDGFVFAGWVVRIPAVKEQTGASASALGLALLGVSAGAVVTMVFTGQLCRRYGSRPVTLACAVLLCLSVVLPPLTHSAAALAAVLLVFGMAYGGINVAMNSAAVDLVAALRRPVMPSFHAAFSLGGMIGAGLGGLVAAHLSPTRHLLALALIGLLVIALAGPALLRHDMPVPPDRPRSDDRAAPGAWKAAPGASSSCSASSPCARRTARARSRTGARSTWSRTWRPTPGSRPPATPASPSP